MSAASPARVCTSRIASSLAALTAAFVLGCSPRESSAASAPPERVEIATSDGGLVHADVYGSGTRAVVLAHGSRFDKQSWEPQARELAAAGFRVLALDFRGYGESQGPGATDPLSAPLHLDVLAAVRWLRANGAASVAAVGGSMGARAAADAAIAGEPTELERLVLLAGAPWSPASKLPGRKLFVITKGDLGPADHLRMPEFQRCYEQAPEPKELLLLEGDAHAQHIFRSDQGERALREIVRFLSAP